MNLTILGGGAWGTALAINASARHATRLWVRDTEQAHRMRTHQRNERYLREVRLPDTLQISTDFDSSVEFARDGLVIIATPMSALSEMLKRLPADPPGVMWLCKGFQEGTGWLGHEVAKAVCPQARVGVLSGPSFAIEVAQGRPTALVAASHDATLCDEAVAALHSENLRIYTSTDPIGVEVGGAVKNVLAIATGIADGMNLGLNARAALVTRGLAEMTRLGMSLGAQPGTFMGLSGLGDLVLTATGDLSRNRKVGLLLAQGLPLQQILRELGHVAEGVYSAAMVLRRAQARGVEMPITEAVVAVLEGRMTPREAVEQLMGREARSEH
ncbi:NAD(P)H-dependent glycerol-3-phosphate dehydrogenase [Piscinibacter terrae]|uniref:Glycerol-3-phosphate dehydrogenase [NAD(P)+] n=1 Tax=Piscinibacter terrae TaxID=2496871 RepID=A0A3N7HHS1_9BURK|nr:NAD(P)H-dependent glycerol-3-phosphate dehydrogenase [Albitalea terrae]RQP21568.1 NAD(P)-dependent glycerol-3-phosphate dehydrogenase [Albitalea terrae]